MECNRVALCGRISELAEMRYTPAGLPVLHFSLSHDSEQIEAGFQRKIQCKVPAMAVADAAQQMKEFALGDMVRIDGFLAQKSRMGTQLVLHVKQIQLLERG
ncbi:MAG: primosomal replication protein N [Burkholderiales bacterium]